MVQGWTQADGSIWPVNALVPVRDPWLGIDGDMLIVQAEHGLSSSGSTTALSLRRPEAFLPEATITAASEAKTWSELR